MGCLFSKKSLSAHKPSDKASTSTRVQHLSNSNSNGIVRIPKNAHKDDRKPDSNDYQPRDENRHRLQMKPPPLAPPPSPPSPTSPIKSPFPEPTAPPTPEDERPPLHVQYAEDLQPATSLQSDMFTMPISDQHRRSKVSVSNVKLKPNMNGIRSSPMPLQDLSIEELDTKMDDFNRFRGKRFIFREGENFNLPTTDTLLPRRKETLTQDDITQLDVDKVVNKTNPLPDNLSKHKTLRSDTPYPKHTVSKGDNQKNTNLPLSISEISEDMTGDLKENVIPDVSKTDKLTTTKLDVGSGREERIVTFDMSNDERYAESTNKAFVHLSSKSDHSINRPGTLTDIHVQTPQDLEANTHPTAVSKTMYEKDLDKSRMSRKRKLNRNRKADYTPRPGSGALNEKESSGFRGGSSKSLKGRQGSATSTWTLDSNKSLDSTDSLYSFDMETGVERNTDRYSYIGSTTTPISFKSYNIDGETEIIDLEDNGDLNNDLKNDSWLTDDQSKAEEPFDVWFGMKPYDVVQSSGRKDAGVVKVAASGPSTSESSTKQKLMYSRFARRPQSESVLRRPPLPPGTRLRTRPASETVKRPNAMSRYFTTDLDIH